MDRVSPCKLLAAALACAALSSQADAEVAPFEGTWLHVGDPYGLVIGHVEAVAIGPDGAVAAEIYVDRTFDPGCESDPTSEACANPRRTEEGVLLVEPVARVLRVDALEAVAPAFAHPMQQEGWEVVRFASEAAWSYRLDGDVLELGREASFDGYGFVLAKVYHRVDPAMPADLFDFLMAANLSVTRAGCAVAAIQTDAAMRDEFRALTAAVARAARGDRAATEDDRQALAKLHGWLAANAGEADALHPGAVDALPGISACIADFM